MSIYQPKPCIHCGDLGGTIANHHPNCIVEQSKPVAHAGVRFAAVGENIVQGSEVHARAKSHTMALRIANALNRYRPNRKGF